jgi:erythromycin esterase-like protein
LDQRERAPAHVHLSPRRHPPTFNPSKKVIGSARALSVSEIATHGTSHEFFTMKDRTFRFLVEVVGLYGFAIEATMPEALRLSTPTSERGAATCRPLVASVLLDL